MEKETLIACLNFLLLFTHYSSKILSLSSIILEIWISLSDYPHWDVFLPFFHRGCKRCNLCPCNWICWCTPPQYDGNVSMVLLEHISHVSCWNSLPHQRLEDAHHRYCSSWTSCAAWLVVSEIEEEKNCLCGESDILLLLLLCFSRTKFSGSKRVAEILTGNLMSIIVILLSNWTSCIAER